MNKNAYSVEPDEAAHNELPHLAQHCLQIQLFSYLANSFH